MLKIYDGGHKANFAARKVFSGGEIHLQLDSEVCEDCDIYADIHSSEDLMELVLTVDALRRNGAVRITLNMDYIPYARQDRVCNKGEPHSLKVFCGIINSLNFERVYVADPHSDVAVALLNNVVVADQTECIGRTMANIARDKSLVLVSPDAGANKKTFKTAQAYKLDWIRADKIRDVSNGNILETVVYCEGLGNRDVLIVDDICDGGRTFIELAKVLRTKTTGKVMLYVTHGIFSQGFEVFDGLIDRIYCYRYFGEERPKDNPNIYIRYTKGAI